MLPPLSARLMEAPMSHPKRRKSDIDADRNRRRIFWFIIGVILLTIAFLIVLLASPAPATLMGGILL